MIIECFLHLFWRRCLCPYAICFPKAIPTWNKSDEVAVLKKAILLYGRAKSLIIIIFIFEFFFDIKINIEKKHFKQNLIQFHVHVHREGEGIVKLQLPNVGCFLYLVPLQVRSKFYPIIGINQLIDNTSLSISASIS